MSDFPDIRINVKKEPQSVGIGVNRPEKDIKVSVSDGENDVKVNVKKEAQNVTIGVKRPEKDIGVSVYRGGAYYPDYSGSYEVTPSATEQVLKTGRKVLLDDIVVKPIPQNYGLITYNGSIITVS